MQKESVVALVFLVLGGLFVFSLLKSLFKMIAGDGKAPSKKSQSILRLFAPSLIYFALLIIFIAFILPRFG